MFLASFFTEAYWTGVTTIQLTKAINGEIKQDLKDLYHLVNNSKISNQESLYKY